MVRKKVSGKVCGDVVQHESCYWHVPKFGLWPIVGLVLFGFLSLANWFLLDWSFLDVEVARSFVFSDFVLVYPFFMEYIFVSGFLISLRALFLGGYGKLVFEKDGLIVGLFLGLFWGLIGGLFLGLFLGLVAGLFWGAIAGLFLVLSD